MTNATPFTKILYYHVTETFITHKNVCYQWYVLSLSNKIKLYNSYDKNVSINNVIHSEYF